MRSLVVNADDFGRADPINQAVIVAHERGVVTSASLMVRCDAAADAAAYARANDRLSVGLHVDLAQWSYTADGWVPDYEVVPVDDQAAVTDEVERQVRRFEELVGRPPTHLDSHQHVHRKEPVRSVVRAMGRRLGVPVRHEDDGIVYRGDFYGRTRTGEPLHDAITAEALIGLVRSLGPGTTEVCCHPSTRGDVDPAYGIERVLEFAVLIDPRVRTAIEVEGIVLRSFAADERADRLPVR
jgi:predicted glycoside hydrolase/deacetylase ChbG (UPF0249 family)